MMQEDIQLSIVVPAHNEENRLGPMLERYADFFFSRHSEITTELIVMVNGSRDRTAEIALHFAERFPAVRVLLEAGKIGKGGAVIRGIQAARGRYIGFVDADGATPPDSFYDLYRRMETCDVAIASRYLKESTVEPRQPLSRIVASRCFNLFVRILFGLRLHDTQCGAKLFRRTVLDRILPRLGVTNWAFDVDMLVQSYREGFTVKEYPTVWQDQSGSQLKLVKAGTEMFVALVRLRLFYSPFKWVISLYHFGQRLCSK